MFARMTAALIALFIGLSSARGTDLHENEMIVGGGSTEADGLWISGPSLYLRRDMPGMFFAMAKAPEGKRTFAYFLLIKGDERRRTFATYSSRSAVAAALGTSAGSVEIAGKRVDVAYQMVIDPTGKQAPQETLTINGQALDLRSGRVVLVDLSGDKVRHEQIDATLPGDPPELRETKDVESLSKRLLDRLSKENKSVRELRR